MKFNGLIGPTYTLPNLSVACQRTVNMVPEPLPDTEGEFWSYGRPGLRVFGEYEVGGLGGRASFASNGRAWVVGQSGLYEIFADGTSVYRGGIPLGPDVQISSNGVQLLITTGNGPGIVYDLGTNVVTAAGGDFPVASSNAMVDGYFIASKVNSRQYQISELYDGLTWDALEFASAEGTADNIKRVYGMDRRLWIFTGGTVQPYFNSGNADFPFAPIQGTMRSVGLKAVASVASTPSPQGDTILWLGTEAGDQGAGVVYRATGYEPAPVSNFAIAWAMQQYEKTSTIEDAVGECFEWNRHYYYQLSFPSAGACWVYDLSTNMWMEWLTWNDESAPADYIPWYARYHFYAFGKHLALDWKSGRIFEVTSDVYMDVDKPLRVLRRFPHIRSGNNRIKYGTMRVGMGVGVGTEAEGQGFDPLIMLRYSDDGGYTWSNELTTEIGKMGNFSQTVQFHRLGSTRYEQGRVFELSCSDPVSQAWFTADLVAE